MSAHGSVVAMARKKQPFDVEVFLHTVDGGRSVSNYRKNQKVFSQGDPADAVFYIQRARSRSASYPSGGRRRSSRSTGMETSSARAA